MRFCERIRWVLIGNRQKIKQVYAMKLISAFKFH